MRESKSLSKVNEKEDIISAIQVLFVILLALMLKRAMKYIEFLRDTFYWMPYFMIITITVFYVIRHIIPPTPVVIVEKKEEPNDSKEGNQDKQGDI